MKTFKFSLVLRTHENTDVFISLDDNIYGIHSKRINILFMLSTENFANMLGIKSDAWWFAAHLQYIYVVSPLCGVACGPPAYTGPWMVSLLGCIHSSDIQMPSYLPECGPGWYATNTKSVNIHLLTTCTKVIA